MAVSLVPQTIADVWATHLPPQVPGTLREGLVTDLAVGDYLVGMRATVAALGATAGTNKTLTVNFAIGGSTRDIVMPTTATVWFTR